MNDELKEGVACFLPGRAEHFNSWGRSKFTQLLVGFISKNDIIQRKYDGTGVSKPFLANIHGGSEACI
jgi:hypothetical protein